MEPFMLFNIKDTNIPENNNTTGKSNPAGYYMHLKTPSGQGCQPP